MSIAASIHILGSIVQDPAWKTTGFTTFLLVGSSIFAFFMAFVVGANDVANALATSVGSKALTVKQAIVIGAIFEFLGSMLLGGSVSKTIRSGIVSPTPFEDSLELFMLGMFGALVAASLWLLVATLFGLPVSTTHTIIGAVAAFGLVGAGVDSVDYKTLLLIVASWFTSPLIGLIVSFIIFKVLYELIIKADDPFDRSLKCLPWFATLTVDLVTVFIILKAAKGKSGMEWYVLLAMIGGITVVCFLGVWLLVVPWLRKRDRPIAFGDQAEQMRDQSPSLLVAAERDMAAENEKQGVLPPLAAEREPKDHDHDSSTNNDSSDNPGAHIVNMDVEHPVDPELVKAESIFIIPMILTAVAVALAHGANDVANAIGPFDAILEINQTGGMKDSRKVPIWVLAIGGGGIVLGLLAMGRRVMATVGEKITKLTFTRGYAAQFSTAATVLMATELGLPVSTTHTMVGAVAGVSLVTGSSGLNRRVLLNIAASWGITIPVGAAISIGVYMSLKNLA